MSSESRYKLRLEPKYMNRRQKHRDSNIVCDIPLMRPKVVLLDRYIAMVIPVGHRAMLPIGGHRAMIH